MSLLEGEGEVCLLYLFMGSRSLFTSNSCKALDMTFELPKGLATQDLSW